jgi:hypothetical protein
VGRIPRSARVAPDPLVDLVLRTGGPDLGSGAGVGARPTSYCDKPASCRNFVATFRTGRCVPSTA